ncbi:MAG: hypothetical protein GX089_03230, partial [Fibrobacter sp.]|nr:hypothetical protein [Fibrobacter sp.]
MIKKIVIAVLAIALIISAVWWLLTGNGKTSSFSFETQKIEIGTIENVITST